VADRARCDGPNTTEDRLVIRPLGKDIAVRQLAAMLICILFVVAACGGSSEAESGNTDPLSSPNPTGSNEEGSDTRSTQSEQVGGSTDDDSSPSGVGEATVVIDGGTFRFAGMSDFGNSCTILFGVLFADLDLVDEAGVEDSGGHVMSMALLTADADPDYVEASPNARNRIEVTFYKSLASGARERTEVWIADEQAGLEPGTSQVDDYTIDGNGASGTATFYETFSKTVAQGTFEVTCAG
jgi:hypothetical protein